MGGYVYHVINRANGRQGIPQPQDYEAFLFPGGLPIRPMLEALRPRIG